MHIRKRSRAQISCTARFVSGLVGNRAADLRLCYSHTAKIMLTHDAVQISIALFQTDNLISVTDQSQTEYKIYNET